MTREMRMELVTENNALGLQEYDLVKTAGKGIGIVLRKKSLNDELVIYSISSASETHPNDDDGMAKVRRYNADGTIAGHSEKTGRRLKNRDIYTIVGIKSYTNPVLAMKDFINQKEDIEFDAVIEEVEDIEDVYEDDCDNCDCDCDCDNCDCDKETPTQAEINVKILTTLDKILEKLG